MQGTHLGIPDSRRSATALHGNGPTPTATGTGTATAPIAGTTATWPTPTRRSATSRSPRPATSSIPRSCSSSARRPATGTGWSTRCCASGSARSTGRASTGCCRTWPTTTSWSAGRPSRPPGRAGTCTRLTEAGRAQLVEWMAIISIERDGLDRVLEPVRGVEGGPSGPIGANITSWIRSGGATTAAPAGRAVLLRRPPRSRRGGPRGQPDGARWGRSPPGGRDRPTVLGDGVVGREPRGPSAAARRDRASPGRGDRPLRRRDPPRRRRARHHGLPAGPVDRGRRGDRARAVRDRRHRSSQRGRGSSPRPSSLARSPSPSHTTDVADAVRTPPGRVVRRVVRQPRAPRPVVPDGARPATEGPRPGDLRPVHGPVPGRIDAAHRRDPLGRDGRGRRPGGQRQALPAPRRGHRRDRARGHRVDPAQGGW